MTRILLPTIYAFAAYLILTFLLGSFLAVLIGIPVAVYLGLSAGKSGPMRSRR